MRSQRERSTQDRRAIWETRRDATEVAFPAAPARFRLLRGSRGLPRRIAGSPVVFPNAAKVPFADGNGPTARLLMNLLLLRAGYPPVAVRQEDRKRYPDTLERASMNEDVGPFQLFMQERLDATLEGS